jgi:hypothetical protein
MPVPVDDQAVGTADHVSRRMWRVFEPYHAVAYFAGEVRRATDALGLKGGWMSYFGTRAAPLGAVPAEVVIALFYNFHPEMVRRAIPDAWSYASPDALLLARLEGVDQSLRRLLGAEVAAGPEIAEAAELARAAAEATGIAGRPLGAANAALPWPAEPHLVLWHATTILREARGDGHVASLLTAGLSPAEALVTASAAGGPPAEMLQTHRKWSQDEWSAAVQRLRARGWLDADGALTPSGQAGRAEVELRTDELARQPWEAIGEARRARLAALLLPVRERLLAAGAFPVPNPMGLVWS